jgi:S-adenosylmethionine decarboxylase
MESNMQSATGVHFLLEIHGCPASRLDDVDFVQRSIETATQRAGLTVIKIVAHSFDPVGVTAIALLSESHLSIHSWPEKGYAAIDLFTCGTAAKPQLACDCLIELFEAESHSLQIIERG